ncbi:MAG: recombinase family protein [Cetobacterium sp.]
MLYGYARVSTRHQNLDRQLKALKDFGVEPRAIQVDKYTGTTLHREGIEFLRKVLTKGDTLVVKEIDRLGRNKEETMNLILELVEKDVDIIVLDSAVFQMYIENLKKDNKSFTDKLIQAQLRGVIEIMLLLAEEERNKIVKRTSEGRDRAKDKGVKFGVEQKIKGEQLEELKKDIELFNQRQMKQVDILKKYNISKPTFKKYKEMLIK